MKSRVAKRTRMEFIMKKKKNSFLTFCFSCLPGAGHMFLGFNKKGLSLMIGFFGLIAITSFLQLDALIFILPVIWFYAFFDAMNLHSMPVEEMEQVPDNFLLIDDSITLHKITSSRFRPVAAVLIILIGLRFLLDNVLDIFSYCGLELDWELRNMLSHNIPQILIALLIIAIGAYLISDKKKDLKQEILEDKGGTRNE